jgi:hypothetical protein
MGFSTSGKKQAEKKHGAQSGTTIPDRCPVRTVVVSGHFHAYSVLAVNSCLATSTATIFATCETRLGRRLGCCQAVYRGAVFSVSYYSLHRAPHNRLPMQS